MTLSISGPRHRGFAGCDCSATLVGSSWRCIHMQSPGRICAAFFRPTLCDVRIGRVSGGRPLQQRPNPPASLMLLRRVLPDKTKNLLTDFRYRESVFQAWSSLYPRSAACNPPSAPPNSWSVASIILLSSADERMRSRSSSSARRNLTSSGPWQHGILVCQYREFRCAVQANSSLVVYQ